MTLDVAAVGLAHQYHCLLCVIQHVNHSSLKSIFAAAQRKEKASFWVISHSSVYGFEHFFSVATVHSSVSMSPCYPLFVLLLTALHQDLRNRVCNGPCLAQSEQLDSYDMSFSLHLRSSVRISKIGTAPMWVPGDWLG